MQTQIVAAPAAAPRVVEMLRSGEVVALPTETVYGLAGDASNADAVVKIFETKERPRFDPLIVHLPARDMLDAVAHGISPLVQQLIEKFWPGPLTVLLPKREAVSDLVTAGLTTVALRMSAHPVFRKIIEAFGKPLAAPSANRFGRISPTTAQHVHDELVGRIPLIVDGGGTTHGIESTIVRVADETIEILRQGPVTAEELREFAPILRHHQTGTVIAPGQLPSHYAPRTKLMLVDNLGDFSPAAGKRVGALSLRQRSSSAGQPGMTGFAAACYLSARGDLREAAASLFGMLRKLDSVNLDLIVAERVPNEGIGVAINERLERAAGG